MALELGLEFTFRTIFRYFTPTDKLNTIILPSAEIRDPCGEHFFIDFFAEDSFEFIGTFNFFHSAHFLHRLILIMRISFISDNRTYGAFHFSTSRLLSTVTVTDC